jgi:hypothetical protein
MQPGESRIRLLTVLIGLIVVIAVIWPSCIACYGRNKSAVSNKYWLP